MKKNHLVLTVGLILLTIIAVVSYWIYGLYAGNPQVEALYIDHISVTNDQVDLHGSTAASAGLFKDYTYSIDGEELYFTINYALRVKEHSTADFDVEIKDDFRQIKKVFLTDEKDKKLIWDRNATAADDASTPAAVVITPTVEAIAPIAQAKTLFTLPTDQITSGKIVDNMIGGTLQYEMTQEEIASFIDYYNSWKFTENDKIKAPADHDSLSDSTDVVLQLADDPALSIVIIGFLDGETMVSYRLCK